MPLIKYMLCGVGTTFFMLGQLVIEHFFKKRFICNYLNVCTCISGYVHMSAGAHRGRRSIRTPEARVKCELPSMSAGN